MTANVLPIKPPSFDLAKAKQNLDLLAKDKVQEIEQDVKLLVVKTPDAQQMAIDIDHDIGDLLKKLDSKEEEILKPAEPALEFAKTVKSIKKALSERLKAVRVALKGKMRDYLNYQEIERRKQQRLIEEANKRLQEDLNKHAAESGVAAPIVTQAPVPKQSTAVHTDSGASSHVRRRWTFEILSEKLIPRQYCSPDPKLIRADVDAGLRDQTDEDGKVLKAAIPGVRIYEDLTPVTR